MASAERSFHRALATLAKLQKQRGFDPAKPHPSQIETAPVGFVPWWHLEEIEENDAHPCSPHHALHENPHDRNRGFVPAEVSKEDSPPVAA